MNLVVGATGLLGGEICSRLAEAGKSVRPTLARFPVKMTSVRECAERALSG